MELIVIDETKLKIMLTAPDMRHYHLHAERMSAANAATRNAFRHIFDDARERIGFDTSGERLLVQLYTSRGGGCEIFVTKLCAEDDMTAFESQDTEPPDHAQDMRELSAEDALLARLAKEDAMSMSPAISSLTHEGFRCNDECEACAFRFSDAEDLFALCRRLAATAYAGESEVYICETRGGSAWYLFLTPAAGESLPPFVREYAPDVPDADTLKLYLSEHGRVICPAGAADIMGKI